MYYSYWVTNYVASVVSHGNTNKSVQFSTVVKNFYVNKLMSRHREIDYGRVHRME